MVFNTVFLWKGPGRKFAYHKESRLYCIDFFINYARNAPPVHDHSRLLFVLVDSSLPFLRCLRARLMRLRRRARLLRAVQPRNLYSRRCSKFSRTRRACAGSTSRLQRLSHTWLPTHASPIRPRIRSQAGCSSPPTTSSSTRGSASSLLRRFSLLYRLLLPASRLLAYLSEVCAPARE